VPINTFLRSRIGLLAVRDDVLLIKLKIPHCTNSRHAIAALRSISAPGIPEHSDTAESRLSAKCLNLHWINSGFRHAVHLARFVNRDWRPLANDDRGFPISPIDGPQQSR
jgi:hypothetical protein